MGILDGKVGVVIGASSGIGWRIVEKYIAEGAQVIAAARRESNLEKLARQTGAIAMRCDISRIEDVQALADAAIKRWGRIDFAVNSSGVVRPCAIADLTPETIQEVAAVQYFGSFYFLKNFGNAMAAHGGGSVISITSTTAILVPVLIAAYSGAKASTQFVTKIAAREYGHAKVRFNCLAPTFVPTAMNSYGGMTKIDEARVDMNSNTDTSLAFIKESPLGRVTTVDDCADVALFLASDLSSSMTGQTLPVDNGNHLMRLPDATSSPES